jgi:hypothetical protein
MEKKSYWIKKKVLAESFQDALKREKNGEIIDVWTDPDEKFNTSAIGFNYGMDEDRRGVGSDRLPRSK